MIAETLPKQGYSTGFSMLFSLTWANKEISKDSLSRGGIGAVKSPGLEINIKLDIHTL